MAQPAERLGTGLSNLQTRVLSAAILLPLVIGAIALGHPYFDILVAVSAAAIAWEWARISGHVRNSGPTSPVPNPPTKAWCLPAAISGATAVAALFSAGSGQPSSQAWLILLIGIVLIGIASFRSWPRTIWFVLGAVYATVPALALVWIRAEPTFGRETLFWIIALVVAADVGGYVVGRTVGGPKLAPRISPNKTWSGLIGAVIGATLVGFAAAYILNHTIVWALVLISAGLGLVEQVGDLVESAVKRHFGVKDASHIIPGHGGVMDRVDGLLAVAVAVLVMTEWAGGSVLGW